MRMLIFLFFISYSVSKSGCRASALIRGPRKAKAFLGKGATAQKANLLSLAAKWAKGRQHAAAAGVGFAGDQPSAMLTLSPKGEYKSVTLRYSVCYYGRKEKRGVHAVYSAVFCLCAVRSVFARLSACSAHRMFSAAVLAEKRFALYFFFCCNIYSVGLVLWV